jgi:hypothetical protein
MLRQTGRWGRSRYDADRFRYAGAFGKRVRKHAAVSSSKMPHAYQQYREHVPGSAVATRPMSRAESTVQYSKAKG